MRINRRTLRSRKLKLKGIGIWLRERLTGPPPESGGVPKGISSDYIKLRRGQLQGGVTCESLQLPVPAPDSESLQCGLNQFSHANWPVFWTHHRNARLLGSSLVHIDRSGRACREAMHGPHSWSDPVMAGPSSSSPVVLNGRWTSLISRWDHGVNYYHWMMDGLARLCQLECLPSDTGILMHAAAKPFARDAVAHLGLSDRVRYVDEDHLLVEEYYFLSPTAISGCANPLGLSWLRDRFLNDVPASARTEKLFITRRAATRTVLDLEQVESAFLREGWTILDPGEMDWESQRLLFSRAAMVAGVHGAGMSNLVWVPAGTPVVEWMPSEFRNACYEGVSILLGNPHRVLVCPSDYSGNLTIGADVLRQTFETFAAYHRP
jgi:hypothetical protein